MDTTDLTKLAPAELARQTLIEQGFFCPMCALPTHENVNDAQIEVTYKMHGKEQYSGGYYGCTACLASLINCIQEHMKIDRINRGISLRAIREQTEKSRKSECGCSG